MLEQHEENCDISVLHKTKHFHHLHWAVVVVVVVVVVMLQVGSLVVLLQDMLVVIQEQQVLLSCLAGDRLKVS